MSPLLQILEARKAYLLTGQEAPSRVFISQALHDEIEAAFYRGVGACLTAPCASILTAAATEELANRFGGMDVVIRDGPIAFE